MNKINYIFKLGVIHKLPVIAIFLFFKLYFSYISPILIDNSSGLVISLIDVKILLFSLNNNFSFPFITNTLKPIFIK